MVLTSMLTLSDAVAADTAFASQLLSFGSHDRKDFGINGATRQVQMTGGGWE